MATAAAATQAYEKVLRDKAGKYPSATEPTAPIINLPVPVELTVIPAQSFNVLLFLNFIWLRAAS